MSIPITCPGCEAVFDVPDNLVGKTIRCTTCKAQVTVAASTEAAKKPFGWAAGSGLAETTDAEPIPEVIRNDTAKTAKATKPDIWGKKTPKSDDTVEEDEEDEDDQPKAKATPAKKTKIAAVAAPTKSSKANKWDDEDADRPKLKKKNKDGDEEKPSNIAFYGGALLTLLSVIGLMLKIFSGGTKPNDTASNSSNTTPAGNMSPNTPVVPAVNWQPVNTGSMACEMPGNPVLRNDPIRTGGTVQLYLLESPSKDHAFFVSSVPIPAAVPANLTAKMLDEAASGFERGMAGGGLGGGGFGRNSQIRVSSKTDIQQDGFPGKELRLAGRTGSEPTGGVLRIVLAGRQMHIFGVGADNYALLQPQAQRFMDSVKISGSPNTGGPVVINDPPKGPPTTTTPGGNPVPPPTTTPGNPPAMPPMPPGGNPVPPMPPGGNPMPPIGGGEVVGNLKTKLSNPFFAGAFDTEKKELIVVGFRTAGNRQAGTIQRYSLPDFKLVGSVNIPSVATRAQLDSAKGLLYVTTVGAGINPTANQYDRPANIGDVAVYDLGPIRNAKFDEKVDTKPVGMISVSRLIRDIVLSADGKSLFVLATTTIGKNKSQIVQVNTADRKTVKTVDLPNVGWDMVPSADGQKLFVTGLATGAIVPPLMVLETGTMTLAPSLALPKSAFSIAVSKDGRIVTSSLGNNGLGAGIGGGGVAIGGGGFGPPNGPGGPGGPGGPPGGGGVGGVVNNPLELNVLDASGNKVEATKPGTVGASNNGYLAVTPDGKYLICSSHHPMLLGTGLDVYETSEKFLGDKLVASMKKAGDAHLGGTFLVSPDSEYIVFLNGAVLKLDDLGGAPGNGPAPPVGGVGGNPMPPMGVPPFGAPPFGVPPKGPGGIGLPPFGK
ncbi:MAG: hypothetical protein C0467_23755 [Planctomycetaceae bacterium]|nr:hypothetical protein [Planctomycetaceae bacterium]